MPQEKLHRVAKRLIMIRALRSVGQGAMVVDLALYLKALHWSGAAIGAVTTGAGLFGALLILLVGVVSDRIGRRPFLFVYEGLTILAAALACVTTAGVMLSLAIIVAGFGRGQNGGAGPFTPAEQAWLAAHVPMRQRGRVFSMNNASGFMGMALGSVIAGVPALLHAHSVLADYRPIFLLVMVISLACCVLIYITPEERRADALNNDSRRVARGNTRAGNADAQIGATSATHIEATPVTQIAATPETKAEATTAKPIAAAAAAQTTATPIAQEGAGGADLAPSDATHDAEWERQTRKRENVAMVKLAAVNTVNGLAVGLTGPMMVYWFNLRYGASSAEIGSTLAVGFVLTGLMSIFSGWMADRVGLVKSVTGMRVIGSSMMFLIPFIPSFWGASGLYAVRSAMNRGTQGNRSALSASIVRDKRRGLSISINALSMRLPSSIGPTISGLLFDAGALNLPIYLTAGLQLVNAWLYQRMFGQYDKSGGSD